jgi:PTS system mannitol-specific IIC component
MSGYWQQIKSENCNHLVFISMAIVGGHNVQNFGKALSRMVMPNIGAFIAWGFITAFFIASGWWPNEQLASMVDPLLKYMLPLLIAISGGRNVAGDRGGIIAAIATMGVIVGSEIPMFIGAMAMGPLSAFLMKKVDRMTEGKVPAGFEMLVNNFSLGILGMVCAIVGFYAIGPIVVFFTRFLSEAISLIMDKGLLPLASLFIEPGKVLFLNNSGPQVHR